MNFYQVSLLDRLPGYFAITYEIIERLLNLTGLFEDFFY